MPAPTPYCTAADLEAVIGSELLLAAAPDPDSPGSVDTGAVESAIAAVSSRIDGYLRARYNLPLPDVPEALRRAAARLAHAELVNEGTTSEVIERRADDARKLVEHISSGKIRLGGDLDGDAADRNTSTGQPEAHISRRPVKFGRSGLRGLV